MGIKKGTKLINKLDGETEEHLALRRLLSRINVNPLNGCWEYTGALTSAGYGEINPYNGNCLVHRVAYEIFIGQVPDNLLVCHHCDNPKCFNPDHLFVGTHRDNSQDSLKKGRAYFSWGLDRNNIKCQKGEQNHMAKLKAHQVLEIREMGKDGFLLKDIAFKFGISITHTSAIIARQRWGWLK